MKCRNCVEYIDEWCDKVKDSTYPDIERECKHFKQATNADRIRSLSDEELATWLNCMQSNAYHCGEFGRLNAAYPFDNKAWLDWLKKEVTT